jgi:tRNA modification GTPase
LLWFPGPASYTGEDVLELHTHGGEVLPRRVLRACLALGARVAEPGEFTRRAFEHGKLDLVQAEAVADLIEASGDAAARGALRSLDGAFSRAVRELQAALTRLRIQTEGALDFPEEELPLAAAQTQRQEARQLGEALAAVLAEARRSRGVRAGRQVVLLGAPNVGKSSLLNRLAGDDLAIVSAQAGTTRDAVRSHLELGGLRLEFIDTAGVREASELVEQLGIERTWAAVARADLVIRLRAPDAPESVPLAAPPGIACLEVWNKSDLLDAAEEVRLLRGVPSPLLVSARTGAGMAELEQAILRALGWQAGAEPAFLARERHIAALEGALDELVRAAQAQADELFAEDLRRAQRSLDAILGEFAADDLLGEIFARFCIGK